MKLDRGTGPRGAKLIEEVGFGAVRSRAWLFPYALPGLSSSWLARTRVGHCLTVRAGSTFGGTTLNDLVTLSP
jgi:hypothetical protein